MIIRSNPAINVSEIILAPKNSIDVKLIKIWKGGMAQPFWGQVVRGSFVMMFLLLPLAGLTTTQGSNSPTFKGMNREVSQPSVSK